MLNIGISLNEATDADGSHVQRTQCQNDRDSAIDSESEEESLSDVVIVA